MRTALWFSICFGMLLLLALPASAAAMSEFETDPEASSGATIEAKAVSVRGRSSVRTGNAICRLFADEATLAERPEATHTKELTGWRAKETSRATEVFLMSFVIAGGIVALWSFVHMHKRRSH